MTASFIIFAIVFVPMLVEAARSRRNEQRLRQAGAVEPRGDVYSLMQVAYPGCFLVILVEGALRGSAGGSFIAGLALFVLAKALKYWAISTLGTRWTFRVLVLPGQPLVVTGPYRYLRHPNYVAVTGEYAGAALMAHAPIAGVVAVIGFGCLMLVRISIEERALGL